MKITSISVNLPFGLGGANIDLNEGQAKAAWALYVEMATRVVTQELEKDTGSVREALTSIYSLFETTREVLRETGPDAVNGKNSVGPIAIRILNEGIRPYLVKWHTSLSQHEGEETIRQQQKLGSNAHIVIDESEWNDYDSFYTELSEFQEEMKVYLDILEKIAGIQE